MDTVSEFILTLDGQPKKLVQELHTLLLACPGVTAKIRYRIPFYYRKSWVCYLNPVKPDQIELVFIRGNELSNEQGLLDARGRKQVAGVLFSDIRQIPVPTIREIIQEALLLDEHVPYASKRF